MSCHDPTFSFRNEGVWVVRNLLLFLQDPLIIEKLLQQDIMAIMLEIIQKESKYVIVTLALSAINELLAKSKTAIILFWSMGGLEKLENLKASRFSEI